VFQTHVYNLRARIHILNSVLGIVTCHGLEGPEIECWWGQDFPHLSGPALRPIQPTVRWELALFRGGKVARAWSWPPNPISRWGQRKSTAISQLPLWAFMACSRVNSTSPLSTSQYPVSKRLGDPQSPCEHFEETISCPCRESKRLV